MASLMKSLMADHQLQGAAAVLFVGAVGFGALELIYLVFRLGQVIAMIAMAIARSLWRNQLVLVFLIWVVVAFLIFATLFETIRSEIRTTIHKELDRRAAGPVAKIEHAVRRQRDSIPSGLFMSPYRGIPSNLTRPTKPVLLETETDIQANPDDESSDWEDYDPLLTPEDCSCPSCNITGR